MYARRTVRTQYDGTGLIVRVKIRVYERNAPRPFIDFRRNPRGKYINYLRYVIFACIITGVEWNRHCHEYANDRRVVIRITYTHTHTQSGQMYIPIKRPWIGV